MPEDGLSAGNAWSEHPAIAPIFALHRHDDGYIAFAVAREAGEDFRPLVSIRRDELARYFPEFREQLLKDSYVSINAGWRLRRYGKDGAAYGYPLHRTERLRYLCAAYADLDYYRLGVDFGQALGPSVGEQIADGLARIGFARGENESLVETFARFLGITSPELRTRLQRRAAGLPAEWATDRS